jgi:HSP20 family molecular chaperone IbpA
LTRLRGALARAENSWKAKATFKNGVLSITLPKPPEIAAKARRIAISPGK